MFYIGGFIIKTIKEGINTKEFDKLMIYTLFKAEIIPIVTILEYFFVSRTYYYNTDK